MVSLFSKLQESVIYYAATSLRKRKINDVQVAVIVIKYGDREVLILVEIDRGLVDKNRNVRR